jgi:hypothetical protein
MPGDRTRTADGGHTGSSCGGLPPSGCAGAGSTFLITPCTRGGSDERVRWLFTSSTHRGAGMRRPSRDLRF